MAIEKLIEFAKDGQKNTDDLNLTDGFHVSKKPARQWFNWLFNSLTSKVNEIIDADFVPKADIVDNLTTDDAKRPVSAKQAKNLQDSKLNKTANAVSATKLQTARTIAISGAVTGTATGFDGSANIAIATTAINGSQISTGTIPAERIPTLNQSTTGNAATATKLQTARTIAISGAVTGTATGFDGSANIAIATTAIDGSQISTGTIPAARIPTLDQSTTGNAATATKLQTARTIAISGAVTGTATGFDGSANIAIATTAINGSQISTGTIPAARIPTLNQSTTGNAATATKLQTARKINGVDFDGSTNIDLPLIGVNQTWQNLTASRAAETIYTNTTGKPIQVAISYNGNNAYFDIGGVEIYMPDYNAFGFAFFIIPNGTTYRIRNQVDINSWSELR